MAGGLPGWYPDPGGAPGQFRFWNGRTWSEALSPTPYAPPPTAPGFDPLQPIGSTPGGSFGSRPGGSGSATGATSPLSALPPRRKFPIGVVIAVVAIGVTIGLAGWFVVPRLFGINLGGEDQSTSGPDEQVCPRRSSTNPPPVDHPNDGWVHGGRLAFPEMGAPWLPPTSDPRVPFGRDVQHQFFVLHPNQGGLGMHWGASVLVSELYAGDGFFSPQEGAEIVTRCVLGEFYGDSVVDRNDTRNEASSLDGYDAWLIQTTLSFSIPDLPSTSEEVTILVVATGEMSSSLFYTSVPADSPPAIFANVEQATKSLKVSG